MKIMLVGDVVGRPGRQAFLKYTAALREKENIDIVIVNGENAAGGRGLTKKALDELYHGGADIVTSGNHIWDKRDVLEIIDREPFLIRPANYPADPPGRGFAVYPFRAKNIGVANLLGRVFMPELDCPFQKAEEIMSRLKKECDIIIFDFHAEATSEKMALAWQLDGRATAVVGTHTHVQTADERLLPKGTAYISDLGMVGARDSILGVKPDIILQKFHTALPVRFDLATGPSIYSAAVIDIDDKKNFAKSISRILICE